MDSLARPSDLDDLRQQYPAMTDTELARHLAFVARLNSFQSRVDKLIRRAARNAPISLAEIALYAGDVAQEYGRGLMWEQANRICRKLRAYVRRRERDGVQAASSAQRHAWRPAPRRRVRNRRTRTRRALARGANADGDSESRGGSRGGAQ